MCNEKSLSWGTPAPTFTISWILSLLRNLRHVSRLMQESDEQIGVDVMPIRIDLLPPEPIAHARMNALALSS